MPPIRQLDDAFLSSLLEEQDYAELKTNVDSESLRAILQKLNSTSDALRQELFEQVHNNFDDFSSWYNSSQALHAQVLDLVKQTSHTQQQTASTQAQVDETINKYQHALAESQKNKSKIDVLEQIEQVLQIVESIEAELKHYSYLDAVQHVLQLSAILKDWRNADPRVVGMIHQRVEQLKQTLIASLQDGIHTAIKYNPGSMRILETYQPSASSSKQVHIRDVFQSLFQLGLLPEELMAVQRSTFKNIFSFYFEYTHCTLQMDPVQVEEQGKGGVLQVIPAPSHDQDEGHVNPVSMLQHMGAILDFIYKYTFAPAGSDDDKDMKLLFGNLFMPDLIELMINKSIAPAVPSTKYNLAGFDHVTQAVHQFEMHCRDAYGFQLDDTSLGSYVENIDRHYAKKRRNRILQEGRKVMLRRLYETEMTSVHEDDGHTYHYHTTQTPHILSVLVSDTLSEGADLLPSHPISASTLMDGIQDLLDMYRAIMPSFHRTQYLASAGNSLVFRNDCLWLANQLTSTIALKPEAKQFSTLKAGLDEAAQRLRELGNAWHELTMMQRVQMIQTVLDHLDGFSGMAENAKFQQDCDRAITQVIELVGSFATETRPVIDETLFLDMLGRIVDSILARLINDIEELVDIGAEESHIIARTLNSLAQLVNAFDLPGKDATEGFVTELVPSWQKFWLVKDILEMNMREIMESFRRGDLHMFEKSELVGLLCSLFADTELREANIQEIKTGASPRSYPRTAVAATQPQQTVSPASVPATTFTPSIHQALVYTPDNDEEALEESGWGDDDDMNLFEEQDNDNGLVNKHTVSQIALEPSPNLEYMEDDTTGVNGDEPGEAGGWGDADQDIFDNDALSISKEEGAGHGKYGADHAKMHSSSAETTSRLIPSKSDTNSPTTAHLLSAPALDLDTEEGDGWGGWNDDDDDELFKD
ncbi:ribosome biogenesis protein ytm1 [Mucor circinelloides]